MASESEAAVVAAAASSFEVAAAVESVWSEAAVVAAWPSGQAGAVAAVEVGPSALEAGWDRGPADLEAFSASCFCNRWLSCCAAETASGSSPGPSGCRWLRRSLGRTPTGRRRSARGRSCASSSASNLKTEKTIPL